MKAFDRIMAITRHPEYLKDWEELKRLRSIDNERAHLWAEEMGERWGEYPPPRPIVGVYNDLFKSGYRDSYIDIVEEISDEDPPFHVDWTSIVLEAHERRLNKKEAVSRPEKSAVTGKHLYLKVDLTAKKTALAKQFKAIIDSYKKFVIEKRGKDKETIYSPWQIYDMRHRDGLNLSQIAQELSGIKGNPSYDDNLMAHYKCVKRSYDKAKEMIMEVGLMTKPLKKP